MPDYRRQRAKAATDKGVGGRHLVSAAIIFVFPGRDGLILPRRRRAATLPAASSSPQRRPSPALSVPHSLFLSLSVSAFL